MDTRANKAKDNLDEVVRVRVPRKLVRRFERLADVRVKRVSELAREAFVQFLNSEEEKTA